MHKDSFTQFKKFHDVFLSKFEEYYLTEEEINNAVKTFLSSDTVVDGVSINLPEGVSLLRAQSFLNNTKEIKKILKDQKDNVICLIFVESIKEKIEVSKNLSSRSASFEMVYVSDSDNMDYFVEIESRLNTMMLEPNNYNKNEVYPEGNIVLAKLYDLVEIYNKLGDALFEKNVRVSIEKDRNDESVNYFV